MDRLVRQWRETGGIEDRRGGNRGRPFGRVYTPADVRLLAEVDEAFGRMSGLATCELLRRQHEVFGEARFGRLAGISPSHLYNLRASKSYAARRTAWPRCMSGSSPGRGRVPPHYRRPTRAWSLRRRKLKLSPRRMSLSMVRPPTVP